VADSPDPATRRMAVARVYDIALSHAAGYREGLTRNRALAEIAEVGADPDILAEAAAAHAVGDNWYAITAVSLLIEAGADQARIGYHINAYGPDFGGGGEHPGP
jgi:hypothetical protein